MTDSYNQSGINLQPFTPIVVTTPDITAVLVTLGTIVDGQSLNVTLEGGGSNPADPNTDNYTVDIGAVATFTRFGGTGAGTLGPIALLQAGGPVVLAFAFVDTATETTCQLSITGIATPYNHNLRFTSVKF